MSLLQSAVMSLSQLSRLFSFSYLPYKISELFEVSPFILYVDVLCRRTVNKWSKNFDERPHRREILMG